MRGTQRGPYYSLFSRGTQRGPYYSLFSHDVHNGELYLLFSHDVHNGELYLPPALLLCTTVSYTSLLPRVVIPLFFPEWVIHPAVIRLFSPRGLLDSSHPVGYPLPRGLFPPSQCGLFLLPHPGCYSRFTVGCC